MPPPPPKLMEELVEEVLLRLPTEDPASLLRAALVCKLWCRLVCGSAFRRRFLEFHHHRGAPPLLGVLYSTTDVVTARDPYYLYVRDRPEILVRMPTAYFVPATSFRPARAAAGRGQFGWCAIDARHGRVLLWRTALSTYGRADLSVWDPVTDEQLDLPKPPLYLHGYYGSWNAAVACAAAAASGNCDHLDCRREPFLVVVVDIKPHNMHFSVYSSEAAAWSKATVWERPTPNDLSILKPAPGVLVRSFFYFLVHLHPNDEMVHPNDEIVEYNMATRQVSMVSLPPRVHRLTRSIVLMTDDDGGLGFVANARDKIQLWSRVAYPHGDASFVLTRVIDLRKVLPSGAVIKNSIQVNGFADGGASRVLFIRMPDGIYSMEINSSQVKKLTSYCCGDNDVVPYLSFCTPTSRVQR